MPQTLLLADDSITVQRVIELTFADEDIRVIAVGDGRQAIELLEQSPPDIVLADVGMPGADGYEVVRHMRSSPRLAHIPVLLLSGAFEPIDPVRASELGCQGVLTKPFEPQVVIDRVKELLGGARMTVDPDVMRPVGVPPSGTPRDVERYFEQLDEAFASLPNATPRLPPRDPQTSAAVSRLSPPRTEPLATSRGSIPLAHAFAALLAAEQSASNVESTMWPALVPSPVSEAVVDEIVRRVLARLSDQVLRTMVSDVVLDVAERLVREEIERIREHAR